MKDYGIYILANDKVYDQLVALLNSIEENFNLKIPICIIPYDDRLTKVKQEINIRKDNVTLFDNQESIDRWEKFAHDVWSAHPKSKDSKWSRTWWSSGHLQRKMCAFDGPFNRFIFCDADSLVMKPLNDVFEKLQTNFFVFDDWIHAKPRLEAPLNIPLLESLDLCTESELRPRLHCSDFFGSRQGLFPKADLESLKKSLIHSREVEWLTAWWDDAHLFNYLTFKLRHPLFNFTLSTQGRDRTGNCADSDSFTNVNNVLYNSEGLKPIHRIHYMNYSSDGFTYLCKGEDVDIAYRDVFLHYRFLKQPEEMPQKLTSPNLFQRSHRLSSKVTRKVQKVLA
ncbi:MAG: Npun_R2821/Npun_R2822 family protein [Leptolyngbyaceae cyanobacterium]